MKLHMLISQSRSWKRVKRLRQVVQEHLFVDGDDEDEGMEHLVTKSVPEPFLAIEGFASVPDLVRYEALQQHSKDDAKTTTPSAINRLSSTGHVAGSSSRVHGCLHANANA
jgi:hypothetical protein